jgi:hypothetical protein
VVVNEAGQRHHPILHRYGNVSRDDIRVSLKLNLNVTLASLALRMFPPLRTTQADGDGPAGCGRAASRILAPPASCGLDRRQIRSKVQT